MNERSPSTSLHLVSCLVALLTLFGAATCSGGREAPRPANTRRTMIEAQQTANRLSGYIWDRAAFADERNRPEILTLLDDLIFRFHRIDEISARHAADPSFPIILENEREILREIRDEFARNQVDTARQRFRSLTGNCIACHSRYPVQIDFISPPPPIATTDLEGKFASAEYLFATRQFDKADEALLQIATTMPQGPFSSVYTMRAIKLWLTIELRIKERPGHAASSLEASHKQLRLEPQDKQLLKEWIAALRNIAQRRFLAVDNLSKARYWLGNRLAEQSPQQDEQSLPRTLHATSILHQILAGDSSPQVRLETLYLLALAYNHLPVDYLSTSRDEYLAAVIMEFPKTPQAAQAFRMYEELKRTVHGKNENGEIALSETGKKRLEHLRLLATR